MRIYVTGIAGAAALNTVSVLDALTKSNTAWRLLHDSSAVDLFDPVLVGLDEDSVEFASGVWVRPGAVAGRDDRPAVVVVPGLDDDVGQSLERNRQWVPWIRRWAGEGVVIASSCTGAFLLAEAGLLEGRKATTHWVAETPFRARYPGVELVIDRTVVDEGDVITSGGATTAFNLVLYLLERFGSADRARTATQMMLLDRGRDTQLPFAMVGLHRSHDDRLVHDAQSAIQQDLVSPLTVAAMAAYLGVSTRTLGRRFDAAIGMNPRGYLEEVRIESAKRLLEQTSNPVGRICAEVGFLDETAFRRAFRRRVGVTPTAYRVRFGPPRAVRAG